MMILMGFNLMDSCANLLSHVLPLASSMEVFSVDV